jgi:hypothetical protein
MRIEDLDTLRGREDQIFGFDVAVHDVLVVRGAEPVGTLQGQFVKLLQADRIPQAPAQRAAFDVLHHQQDFALVLKHVINGGDVRVIQRGGALRFLQKAAAVPFVELELRGHPLDGYAPPKDRVFGNVNLAHPTRTQAALNQEAADGLTG